MFKKCMQSEVITQVKGEYNQSTSDKESINNLEPNKIMETMDE